MTKSTTRMIPRLLLIALAGLALAACETTGTSAPAKTSTAPASRVAPEAVDLVFQRWW